jgi:hypothetical protein
MGHRAHLVLNMSVSCFEFVSDFGFRISCLALLALLIPVADVCADDSYSQNAARLEKMTADQKEELRRKKLRFDGLNSDEQQRLRDLHTELTSDANAKELLDTARSYNRWLATLDSAERSTLLDIKDPQERIARIKELMQQQEERRFRDYAGNLPEEDRGAIYRWVGEWVIAHADQIREQSPRDSRQRIDDAPDQESRRRALISAWQQGRQRQLVPSAAEYGELFKGLSSDTEKTIESLVGTELTKEPEEQRTRERQQALQQQRLADIVRIALWTRNFPLVSQEELLKFYAEMKTDDPRRKQLEGKEGVELRRELLFLYNRDRFGRGGPTGGPGRGFGPGGPGPGGFGPWGPPPGGPRGEGRGGRPDGKPGERFDERDRGGKPPGERSTTPEKSN